MLAFPYKRNSQKRSPAKERNRCGHPSRVKRSSYVMPRRQSPATAGPPPPTPPSRPRVSGKNTTPPPTTAGGALPSPKPPLSPPSPPVLSKRRPGRPLLSIWEGPTENWTGPCTPESAHHTHAHVRQCSPHACSCTPVLTTRVLLSSQATRATCGPMLYATVKKWLPEPLDTASEHFLC